MGWDVQTRAIRDDFRGLHRPCDRCTAYRLVKHLPCGAVDRKRRMAAAMAVGPEFLHGIGHGERRNTGHRHFIGTVQGISQSARYVVVEFSLDGVAAHAHVVCCAKSAGDFKNKVHFIHNSNKVLVTIDILKIAAAYSIAAVILTSDVSP